MQIRYATTFEKRFKKLPPKLKKKVIFVIQKFTENPYDKSLRNHALKGRLEEKRAIWVTGDVRIIFHEYENYTLVLMLDVGTHTQVY